MFDFTLLIVCNALYSSIHAIWCNHLIQPLMQDLDLEKSQHRVTNNHKHTHCLCPS
ncbi:hypothetical protein PISMIDRAFT_182080 [Pisolithus microcarpus 441]|uniref:Unplaced genomic scaffold scaffold_117, whole genome shotgun sequence n=1 Tax=Pisolithus microcarpus 441 TaxID=765257 RepID=A0A0C9YXK9_9AGAM|nr:hypothetical protein PISMIDRAFT_182080 [Pisolithus microcarpus 441]